jgi:ATPase subunit of ABC transporter with duplicated ATPase domains
MSWMIVALLLALFVEPPAAGNALEKKLEELRVRYENGSAEAKDFEIQEAEANDYLRAQGATLPEGVESPWIRFDEGLTVVGATVDLEKFRTNLPPSMLFQLLSGRVPVEIEARIEGASGVGKLELVRVLLGGLELPASLVSAMAHSESASQFLPPGFRLGESFELPYDLESIRCRLGSVLVQQRPTVLTGR